MRWPVKGAKEQSGELGFHLAIAQPKTLPWRGKGPAGNHGHGASGFGCGGLAETGESQGLVPISEGGGTHTGCLPQPQGGGSRRQGAFSTAGKWPGGI